MPWHPHVAIEVRDLFRSYTPHHWDSVSERYRARWLGARASRNELRRQMRDPDATVKCARVECGALTPKWSDTGAVRTYCSETCRRSEASRRVMSKARAVAKAREAARAEERKRLFKRSTATRAGLRRKT